jgi:hypothetical protein
MERRPASRDDRFAMTEPGGHELLEEWRGVVESLLATAATATGHSEVPRELLGAVRRQLELMQEVLERERGLQRELASRAAAPIDAIFDLLEQSGASLRSQAEALEKAGEALQETAHLIESQAALFERTIAVLREPAEMAKAAAGLPRRHAKGAEEP